MAIPKDNMIFYIENSEESTDKFLELINDFWRRLCTEPNTNCISIY